MLTGITFDDTTLTAGAVLVLGFVVLIASAKAVIGMIKAGGGR